jgi:hypothetical protein
MPLSSGSLWRPTSSSAARRYNSSICGQLKTWLDRLLVPGQDLHVQQKGRRNSQAANSSSRPAARSPASSASRPRVHGRRRGPGSARNGARRPVAQALKAARAQRRASYAADAAVITATALRDRGPGLIRNWGLRLRSRCATIGLHIGRAS